ncbi:hypothetical protein T484DRAFT_1830061 [Baffinella frigidus]|nr:hypothetical protein T484DRAFT_1830061 [Cryptophyta sp. CCMP2293]
MRVIALKLRFNSAKNSLSFYWHTFVVGNAAVDQEGMHGKASVLARSANLSKRGAASALARRGEASALARSARILQVSAMLLGTHLKADLQATFEAWAGVVREDKKAAATLRKVVTMWVQSSTSSAFEQWADATEEIQRTRRILMGAVARFKMRGMHDRLLRWHEFASRTARMRKLVRTASMWSNTTSRREVLWAWFDRAHSKDWQGLFRRAESSAHTQSLRAAFQPWLHRILLRRLSELAHAYGGWAEVAPARHLQREVACTDLRGQSEEALTGRVVACTDLRGQCEEAFTGRVIRAWRRNARRHRIRTAIGREIAWKHRNLLLGFSFEKSVPFIFFVTLKLQTQA